MGSPVTLTCKTPPTVAVPLTKMRLDVEEFRAIAVELSEFKVKFPIRERALVELLTSKVPSTVADPVIRIPPARKVAPLLTDMLPVRSVLTTKVPA
jgi:hypothetical protein